MAEPSEGPGGPADKAMGKPAAIKQWWAGMTDVFGSEVLILLASVSARFFI